MRKLALAAPTQILSVGNSFTYTRPPVLQYDTANVVDMNLRGLLDANPAGWDLRSNIAHERSNGARACTPR